MEAVFEPFHRLEASRNRGTGGSGLGLTISPRAAEQHGRAPPQESARRRVGSDGTAAQIGNVSKEWMTWPSDDVAWC
jgi:signal transduction histidine kinase